LKYTSRTKPITATDALEATIKVVGKDFIVKWIVSEAPIFPASSIA
jgi:hypothetical protein